MISRGSLIASHKWVRNQYRLLPFSISVTANTIVCKTILSIGRDDSEHDFLIIRLQWSFIQYKHWFISIPKPSQWSMICQKDMLKPTIVLHFGTTRRISLQKDIHICGQHLLGPLIWSKSIHIRGFFCSVCFSIVTSTPWFLHL